MDREPGERRRRLARALRLCGPTLLALTLLGGGATLAYQTLVAGELLRVKAIRFTGLVRLAPEELLKAIPVARGDHLLGVDTDDVEAALAKVGWIARARARRSFAERTVDVQVEERRAAALAMMGDLYLVDEHGEVFEHARPGFGLDLPVITGIDLDDYLARRAELSQVLAGAVSLAGRWAEARLDARMPISEIHVDPVFGTSVVTGDGAEIRLGQRDLQAKLSRLARLLPSLAAEPRKIEVIHLDDRRHPERVTVRFAGEAQSPLTTASAGVGAPARQGPGAARILEAGMLGIPAAGQPRANRKRRAPRSTRGRTGVPRLRSCAPTASPAGRGRSPRVMGGPVTAARPETAGAR